MKKILLLLSFLFLATAPLHAQYKLLVRKNGFLAPNDKIIAFFFDSTSHRMLIKDEEDISLPKYGSLDAAMRKSPAVAGINGSFFSADKKGTPIGMIVQDGKKLHPLETGAFTVSGIIYDTGRNICIKRSIAFAEKNKNIQIKSALQGGPFLVENGKTVAGLNDSKKTIRTFMATDGNDNWCIAITSPLTLKELSSWLVKNGTFGNFTVKTALNLDGGTSSAFWCHEKGIYHPSVKQVRNYIGIALR